MHYHVVACSASGTVFREHSFDQPQEGIDFFLDITQKLFQDKIIGSVAEIENFMNEQVEEQSVDAVTIGQPAFIMAWVPCEGCIQRKIYN